jgi:excisionase family DNA binding protein
METVAVPQARGRSPKLLTTDEAAELVGAKPQTLSIWRCTKRHNIPFVRVGRLIRYREQDVLDWLDRNTIHSEEANGGTE